MPHSRLPCIRTHPPSHTGCLELKTEAEQPNALKNLLPSRVPCLEARGQEAKPRSYKRIFVSPKCEDETESVFARYVEVYWDKISSRVFGQAKTFEEDLEQIRLNSEKDIQAWPEEAKNNLRLGLVEACGPLFLKSLDNQSLKNTAALRYLNQSSIQEEHKRSCIEALKSLSSEEAQGLLTTLQHLLPQNIEHNLNFCTYILNTLDNKAVVQAVVMDCFERNLYIGKYEVLLQVIEDPSLKNDICFDLLAKPQFSHQARKVFLSYIHVQTLEDIERKHKLLEGLLLRQMHPFFRILQDFLPFIEDENLKACLLLYYLSKRPLDEKASELIQDQVKDSIVRYWMHRLLQITDLQEPEALQLLANDLALEMNSDQSIQASFPKVRDFDQALSFICRFLRYQEKNLGQSKVEKALKVFLESLDISIQEDVLYRLVYEDALSKETRTCAARQVPDGQLREHYLEDIEQNIDRKRLNRMKLASPTE